MVAYYRALLKQTYINLTEGSDKVSDMVYPYNFFKSLLLLLTENKHEK